MYDVRVTVVDKSGGNSTTDSYINATLWTVVFVDPVGDIPGFEVSILPGGTVVELNTRLWFGGWIFRCCRSSGSNL